jgi:thioredoxin 1
MKKKIIVLGSAGIVILAGVLAFYFLYLGNPSRQSLATVNGEVVTREQFDKELNKVEEPIRTMYKEEPEKLLEGMIMKTVLLQEAKKQGITPPAKTYKDSDKSSLPPDEAMIGELMKKKFSTPLEVTPEEIEAFYKMFKEQMGGKKLNEVSPAIKQIIQEGKQQQAVEEYLQAMRKEAKVEIEENRLKKMAVTPPESNSEEEFKKALKGGKPILVDFGANNCVPCRQMRPILKELGQEYAGKAEVLVIDVYKYQGLAREYKVSLIPTLVFFDAKGKEVFRQMGAMEKGKITEKFKEIGAGA